MTKVLEHDAITGLTVERKPTTKELEQIATDQISNEIEAKAQAAKAVARQAVLDKLGLTADEAAALFGQFGVTGNAYRLRNHTR